MLKTLIDSLNTAQRANLHAFGVDSALLSRWRTGKRLPTEVQVAFLADLTGSDRHALQDEIALMRATPEQRGVLERIMGKARAVGATSLVFLASLLVVAASAGSSMEADRRFADRLRRR